MHATIRRYDGIDVARTEELTRGLTRASSRS